MAKKLVDKFAQKVSALGYSDIAGQLRAELDDKMLNDLSGLPDSNLHWYLTKMSIKIEPVVVEAIKRRTIDPKDPDEDEEPPRIEQSQNDAMRDFDKLAKELSKELEEQFSAFNIEWMSGVDGFAASHMIRMKQLGEEAGVQVCERGTVHEVRGSIEQVQKLLHDMGKSCFRIKPLDPQGFVEGIWQKCEGGLARARELLLPFGFQSKEVVEMLSNKVKEQVEPRMQLFHLCLQEVAGPILGMWAEQAQSCADELQLDDLEELEQLAVEEQLAVGELDLLAAGLKQLHEKGSRDPTEPKASIAAAFVRLADQLVEKIEEHKKAVRSMSLPKRLSLLLRGVSGEELFATTGKEIDGDDEATPSSRLEEYIPSIAHFKEKMLDDSELALVVAMEKGAIETEQISRLQEELRIAFAPLACRCPPKEVLHSMARELLLGEVEGSEVIDKKLQECDALETADIALLDALIDVESNLETDSSKSRLSTEWAHQVREAVRHACSTLKQKAATDYRLALCRKTRQAWRDYLRDDLGIEQTAIEPLEGLDLGDGTPKFQVFFASQDDMAKVIKYSLVFTDLGGVIFRLPQDCWVSSWKEAVFYDKRYASFIQRSDRDADFIVYKSNFQREVLKARFTDYLFVVQGIDVNVFYRFSLLLFPLRPGTIDKEMLSKVVGEHVGEDIHCKGVIPLAASSHLGCITLEATPEVRAKLSTPQQVQMPAEEGGSLTMILGPMDKDGEWVWSSEVPSGILQEYKQWQKHKLQQLTDELKDEMRNAPVLDLKLRLTELIRTARLQELEEVDEQSVRSALQVLADFQNEELEAEIQRIAEILCDIVSVKFASEQLPLAPVASVKVLNPALSKEQVIRDCLEPLVESLHQEIHSHEFDRDWLQTVVSKPIVPGKPGGKLQQALQGRAAHLLHALVRWTRLQLAGKHLGIICPSNEFVENAMDIFKDWNLEEADVSPDALSAMVGLVYKHKGRRHIPDAILNRIRDGTSTMDQSTEKTWNHPALHGASATTAGPSSNDRSLGLLVASELTDTQWVVKLLRQIFEVFSSSQECCVSLRMANRLSFLLRGDKLAERCHEERAYFLFSNGDAVFSRLLHDRSVGCEVMRQLPCTLKLRRGNDIDEGFRLLDSYRANQAFVTYSELGDDGRWRVNFSVWRANLETLPLKDFECVQMKLVKDGGGEELNRVAFPVTRTEAVVFGTFSRAPSGSGIEIKPKQSLPPPSAAEVESDAEGAAALSSRVGSGAADTNLRAWRAPGLMSLQGCPPKLACSMGFRCCLAHHGMNEFLLEGEKQHLKDQLHVCPHRQLCRDRCHPEHEQVWMHCEDDADCSRADWYLSCNSMSPRGQYVAMHHLLCPWCHGAECTIQLPRHFQRYYCDHIEPRANDSAVVHQHLDDCPSNNSSGRRKGARAEAAAATAATTPTLSDSPSSYLPEPAKPKKLSFDHVQGSLTGRRWHRQRAPSLLQ